jgi:hypothetical protein
MAATAAIALAVCTERGASSPEGGGERSPRPSFAPARATPLPPERARAREVEGEEPMHDTDDVLVLRAMTLGDPDSPRDAIHLDADGVVHVFDDVVGRKDLGRLHPDGRIEIGGRVSRLHADGRLEGVGVPDEGPYVLGRDGSLYHEGELVFAFTPDGFLTGSLIDTPIALHVPPEARRVAMLMILLSFETWDLRLSIRGG